MRSATAVSLAALGVGCVALALAVLYRRPVLDVVAAVSSVERMEAAIASWGVWAPLASIVLMVIHSFVPFPAEMLAIANGMLFGLALGTAVTWVGAMLGALLAFGIARWLGQAYVRRLVGEARWQRLEALTAGHGAKALLLARVTPVVAFNLVNYAAGLARVRWWTFIWTTGLGILPITVASVLVGSHMAVIPWPLWAALTAIVAALMVLHWRYRHAAPPRENPEIR